ncbi:hypothetical protein Trydic_g22397 [Trypoxylus dichotomus]
MSFGNRNSSKNSVVYLEKPTWDESVVHIRPPNFNIGAETYNAVFLATGNPPVIRDHERDSPNVNDLCTVTAAGIIVSYFFDIPTVTPDVYLTMLEQYTTDELPLQIIRTVQAYLGETFPRQWIDGDGPLRWPPQSPDLTQGDFWL